jgi:hypothetical protein
LRAVNTFRAALALKRPRLKIVGIRHLPLRLLAPRAAAKKPMGVRPSTVITRNLSQRLRAELTRPLKTRFFLL